MKGMRRKIKAIEVKIKDPDGQWHKYVTRQFQSLQDAIDYYVKATQLPSENVQANFV